MANNGLDWQFDARSLSNHKEIKKSGREGGRWIERKRRNKHTRTHTQKREKRKVAMTKATVTTLATLMTLTTLTTTTSCILIALLIRLGQLIESIYFVKQLRRWVRRSFPIFTVLSEKDRLSFVLFIKTRPSIHVVGDGAIECVAILPTVSSDSLQIPFRFSLDSL